MHNTSNSRLFVIHHRQLSSSIVSHCPHTLSATSVSSLQITLTIRHTATTIERAGKFGICEFDLYVFLIETYPGWTKLNCGPLLSCWSAHNSLWKLVKNGSVTIETATVASSLASRSVWAGSAIHMSNNFSFHFVFIILLIVFSF